MTYAYTVNKACATRDIALAEIWTKLAAMGWTLVDGNITPFTVAYTAVDIGADTITSAAHGLVNGTPVQLKTTGTAPGGLAVLTQYYVVGKTTDTIQLSTTYNGSAINITSQGTGNHTIAEAYRVYSSNGEGGDKAPECIQFKFFAAAVNISPYMGYKWDSTTKVLVATNASQYVGDIIGTIETGFYLWIYGNKNIVRISTKIVSTYSGLMFGHFKPFLTLATNLTAGATSGAGATLTVTSTVGFEVGYTYQLISMVGEGRDAVTVASIISSTQMTVTSLPRNYTSGSLLAIMASTFFLMCSNGAGTYSCSPVAASGLTSVANWSSGGIGVFFNAANVDPDFASQKHILSPLFFTSLQDGMSSQNLSLGGYMDEYILWAQNNASTLNIEDTLSVTRNDSGTSSGTNNSATVMYDTAKSWATNAFANKVVVVTFGTGQGQIKKIASNTATTLTLASGYTFETVLDNTSQYIICDEAYRTIGVINTNFIVCREGI